MHDTLHIAPASVEADIAIARALFAEYAAGLGIDLCFQGFAAELAGLPGDYAPPAGRLLLARAPDGTPAGCVALRPLEPGVCEMKRLFVRPAWRGGGAGRALAGAILAEARAIGLYRGLGFREIGPYRHNPVPGALFFECDLGPGGA